MKAFLNALRSFYKWSYHILSGKGQLQRLSLINDKPRIEMSIRCSKQLRRSLPRILSKDFDNNIFQEMCAIKQIPSGRTKERLRQNMNEIVNIYKFVDSVEKIIFVKYSSENDEHERRLLEIWGNLKPNEELKNRMSTQWIDLGFQDKDPATDFRGAGSMGLINLHEFTKTEQGKQVFEVASHPDTQYFFASASLYMSLLTYHLIRERRMDKLVYKFNQEPIKLYQQVYEKIFVSWNQFWLQCQDKSMMKTNFNLESFAQGLRVKTPEQLIWHIGFQVPN